MKTLIAVCLVALPAAAQAMGMSGGGCGRPSGACVHLAAVLYAALAALGYWVLQHSEKEGQGLVKKTGRSKAFYLRVKGEVEAALTKLKFRRLDILRPGLLRGRRSDDRRPLERLAMLASPLSDPVTGQSLGVDGGHWIA